MMYLAKPLCLLFAGAVLGWCLRDTMSIDGTPQVSGSPASVPLGQTTRSRFLALPQPGELDYSQVSEPDVLPNVARFRALLLGQEFTAALAYYEQALLLNEAYQQLLKPELENYLKVCLGKCGNGIFLEVVNLWLAEYYQDVSVLLLLAEHQRLEGYPEQAASTLKLAATYASQNEQKIDIQAAVQRLVMSQDETLSRQENWVELLSFYQYLETIGLRTREFQLREATIYRVIGEIQRSRELLLELKARDTKSNNKWTADLDRQLSLSSPQQGAGERRGHSIAVTRHGDHFLVEADLNRTVTVKLLIDTGASMTTLTQASFDSLPGTNFEYRDSHMFETANGLVRGDVYRAASIGLGDLQLNDIDIAVLDYPSATGANGLLGMNVLRHYRFEIDQDGSLLHLHPRE